MNTLFTDKIIHELVSDAELALKKSGSYYTGKCPACSKKELFISFDKPYVLKCNRANKCGFSQHTRERYSYLYNKISEMAPPEPYNPTATADAYLEVNRGFDISKLKGRYDQGYYTTRDGKRYHTVRFFLNKEKTRYWERLIDASKEDVKQRNNIGGKRKEDGTLYKGDYWAPPDMEVDINDEIFIVEGVFHAIAFWLSGKKAIAKLAAGNFPQSFIDEHSNKGLTYVLAPDNDPAGFQYTYSHRKKLIEAGILQAHIDYCLPPSGDKDWDDYYRLNLGETFLKKCLIRGRIEFAQSKEERAYWLYEKYRRRMFITHFNNEMYQVSITNKAIEELNNLTNSHPDRIIVFQSQVQYVRISNCYPVLLYTEKDIYTKEILYTYKISHRNGQRPDIIELSSSATSDAKSFRKGILNKSVGASFTGKDAAIDLLQDWWFNKPLSTVESYPFVGYVGDGVYVFRDHAYFGGKMIGKNEYGFFEKGGKAVKSTLKGIHLEHSTEFNADWISTFLQLFGYKGICALGFFTMSLFAEQIRNEQQSILFLEVVGQPGTGKSSMLSFLWKLVGRDHYEGFDPSKATMPARYRHFEQVSNLPVVLIEGDRGDDEAKKHIKQFEWDELKTAYNGGVLRPRAPKNTGNETMEQNFKGTLIISQNAEIDGSQALLERLVQLYFDMTGHSYETRQAAKQFEKIKTADVCGFLHCVLSREDELLKVYFNAYNHYLKLFEGIDTIHSQRVRKNHAQLLAGVSIASEIFPIIKQNMGGVYQHFLKLIDKASLRLGSDHPEVEHFWQLYEYLNEEKERASSYEGDYYMTGEMKQTLNHSKNIELIAINFQHFYSECVQRKAATFDIKRIQKLLKNSKKYRFIECKTVDSSILGKKIFCWVFNNNKKRNV